MNRVYNNESIIILCISRLLSYGAMDAAKLMLMVVFTVDDRIRTMVTNSNSADELFVILHNDKLLNRKYISYSPYFLNSLIVLKQLGVIAVKETNIYLINDMFNKNTKTGSNRMTRVLNASEKVNAILSGMDASELYNKAGIKL